MDCGALDMVSQMSKYTINEVSKTGPHIWKSEDIAGG
jgi:hypothetical protein